MKKRFVSMLLALAMCMGLAVPAFAAKPVEETITLEQLESEIQAEKDRIYATVYEQLEAQGVLGLMDIYKEILDPQIEMTVIGKHMEDGTLPENVAVPYAQKHYYFEHGGVLTYNNIATGAEVVATYMDKETTTTYLNNSSFIVADVIMELLGRLPDNWGTIFTVLSNVLTIVSDAKKANIENSGGRAYVLNVHDPISDEYGSTLFSWESFPHVYIDTQFSENITARAF